MFGVLYVGIGLLISLNMFYWGVLSNGGFELNDKQKKVYTIIWWTNLLLNKGPYIPYNNQPFKDVKKGWYSSAALITLIFETFLGFFVIIGCSEMNTFGLVFYGTIISYILLSIIYVFSVIWEITDAKINGKGFPYGRILMPIFTIVVIGLIVYIIMKFMGAI